MFIISSLFFILIWLFPSFVALVRKHNNFLPILIVNLFLTFTGIGYFIALAWAFSSDVSKKSNNRRVRDWHLFSGYFVIIILAIIFGFSTIKMLYDKHDVNRVINTIIIEEEDEMLLNQSKK